jgi:hypothetical protein
MQTTINNKESVFMVITGEDKVFCNLKDLPDLISEGCKVYHFWNNKPRICSKKLLVAMVKEGMGGIG